MLGYLSADIIFSEKRTVFRERSSRNTVRFSEQVMSKDKYPRLFSRQMEAIVFQIFQIFFATLAVFKIGENININSTNLLSFYHECLSLIGYATHYLFNNYLLFKDDFQSVLRSLRTLMFINIINGALDAMRIDVIR